jgi:glycosyltransferase involved in cell wall biosynthesis
MAVRISLVMPNYNHAAYLERSVGAMLAQTRPADEIIIIDDASTDDSLAIIDAVTKGNPHVRVVRHETRAGVVSALNEGLSLASGDFVGFLGADDEVHEGFIASLMPLIEAHPEAGFGCGRVVLKDEGDRIAGERPIIRPTAQARYVPPADVRRQLASADNFFLGQVTLYSRRRLIQLGGFDASLGSLSDGMQQRRLATRWGYVFLPEVLGVWRVHGANYSVASATDPATIEAMVRNARLVLAEEDQALYPHDYPHIFERRLRFNGARLLTTEIARAPAITDRISAIIGGSRLDQVVLGAARHFGRLAPVAATAWLALRLRPMSPWWLMSEAALRLKARLTRARAL